MEPFGLFGTSSISVCIGVSPAESSAAACAGGSRTTKACFRSAKAKAALQILLSVTPGISKRLKMSSLSRELSASKTDEKSASLKVVATPAGAVLMSA